MDKIFLICLILLGFFLIDFKFHNVWAEEVIPALDENVNYKMKQYLENEVAVVKPGILPNSFWYWADVFGEELRFIFTVGKESKGDYLIILASERMAEMKSLSEQGITKHAEKLISQHETTINKAQALYELAKKDGWQTVQQKQTELEEEILASEAKIKKEAYQAPVKYEKTRDTAIKQVVGWFKKVLSHLSWKRGKILQQEAQFSE